MSEPSLAALVLLSVAAAYLALAFQLKLLRDELARYAERVATLPIRRPRGRPPLPPVPGAPPAKKRPHRKKVYPQAAPEPAPPAAPPASPPVDNFSTAEG